MPTVRMAGAGVNLAGLREGPSGGRSVILLHGGGQTRHAWGTTVRALAARGYDVLALDLRGHGESDWAPDGDYGLTAYRDDIRAVLAALDRSAVLVGASLGGLTSLLVAGEAPQAPVEALVLVDIVPWADRAGTQRIRDFMSANPDGFADVEAAAEAVSQYLPHRPRPRDPSGLMKNLRPTGDGRLRWHWDPAVVRNDERALEAWEPRLVAAAERIAVPTLLVRGDQSEVVTAEGAARMKTLIPHIHLVDVTGASHMVAGDRNSAFDASVLGFLDAHAPVE